ncbi:MAG: glycoside hydrolase family 5 protein [Clostridiales bacterium]|nr:glycoside hydrolase family 5 protein [Clostridiales bacterium]
MEQILTSGKRFLDECGRERIFNGINMVDKEELRPGGEKVNFNVPQDDEFYKKLKELGFNLIRLGFTWSAVEPQPGKYNEEFLDNVGKVLDKCAENGIYAFLDMHQDLYSGFGLGVGDGAPAWACLTDGYKAHPHKIVWAEGYFWGRAVQHAYDNFWKNTQYNGRGLLDWYADMWKHVSDKFKNHPALFGFDLLNEPYPGIVGGKIFRTLVANLVKVTLTDKRIKKGKLIKDALSKNNKARVFEQYGSGILETVTSSAASLVEKFDTERYSPFLNKVSTSIRENTEKGIIFIDDCYYSNLGIMCCAKNIEVNGGKEPLTCYGPHAYDFMVDTPLYKYASSDRVTFMFDQHKKAQERLNVPVVVGEWGGFSEGTDWFPHVEYLLSLYDRNKWSNTFWCYFDGLLDLPLMDVLTRPYPRAVTGEIVAYSHDREAGTFTLEYTQDKKFKEPTVIFLHKPAVSVETDGKYEIEQISNGAAVLKVKTQPGTHKIVVKF